MPKAEMEEKVSVEAGSFFKALVSYEKYPDVIDGFKSVKVKRLSESEAEVTYRFSVLLKTIEYTLKLKEDPAGGKLSWTLKDSDVFKVNNGDWVVVSEGPGKCRAKYTLELDFKVPVPGMILEKLAKGSMPAMFKSFEKLAKKTK